MFMLNRRLLLGLLSAAAVSPTKVLSQQRGSPLLKRVRTGVLEIAYEDSGPEAGFPVLLMHGWPYDPRCYDEVVPPLVAAGYRTIVPYLRGFGATRFLAAETPRSGQQAALGGDLLDLMDALNLPRAALVGFDWGGRAAAVVAVMTAHEVLVELTRIARANMADYIRAFASSNPVEAMSKLTSAQTAALAEVAVEQFMDGAGDDAREVRRIRFKLVAKTPALELLGKHHRLYVERREREWGAGLADRLAAALARVDGDREPAQEEARAISHEANGSWWPTDRRRRSPRAVRTGRDRQNVAGKAPSKGRKAAWSPSLGSSQCEREDR
jgi:pimeloyl-ACP methyl ester carboxylesterase